MSKEVNDMIIHNAKKGEQLPEIAEQYGISPYRLAAINGLDVYARLYEGEKILVTIPTKTYNVKIGDSLESISLRFGEKKERILEINPENCGKERLYRGQCIAVRCEDPKYGAIATNGYLYPGYTKNRLISCMPYLSVITAASIKISGGKLCFIMDDREICEICSLYNKPLIARIYIDSLPQKEEVQSLAKGIAIAAKSKGYMGVTLCAPYGKYDSEAYNDLLIHAREELANCELVIYTEADAELLRQEESDTGGRIIFYDKLHKKPIPKFNDAEANILEKYAGCFEASRTFVDLSPYAFYKGKYIEKEKARKILLSHRTQVSYSDEERIIEGEIAHSEEKIYMESLSGVKSRLELISSLGYLGAAIDIMRTPQCELVLLSDMFSVLKMQNVGKS